MAVSLLVASLAVAGVTHVWMAGSLFAPVRARLDRLTTHRRWWLRMPARGARCHFCVSCWLAIGVAVYTNDPLLGAATVLPANAVLVLFVAITERLPMFIDVELSRRGVKVKRPERVA